jgi:hypothetical protein
MRMVKKCGDCIHADICKEINGGWFSPKNPAYCKAFKDRTNFVEVVRCKDCKWYNRNEDIMPQSGSCEFHEMVKMDWDFCSRAKMDGDGNG